MSILPQYIQYKLNTQTNLDSDEIEIISSTINESDDPLFVVKTFSLLMRHPDIKKIQNYILHTVTCAALGRYKFEPLFKDINQNGFNYHDLLWP